ncbi:sulfite exporter TauE/SafE family protein [Myxococcota bacterium]|nr:sulfite exporter TauE/SafE family protein [Myxococcota bacterium]
MTDLALLGSAVWLGILTSISPCPLATNLAAVTFIGKHVTSPRRVFLSGLAYTLGRAVFYTALSLLLIHGLLSAPLTSLYLQKYMIMALGPILLLTGMFLVELITLPGTGSGAGWTAKAASRLGTGIPASFGLGFLFASALCPVSGAIFFGSLIPLSLQSATPVFPPIAYGVGTGLPVLGLALAVALGVSSWSKLFGRITSAERYLRLGTGLVFMGLGIWFTLKYLFRLW